MQGEYGDFIKRGASVTGVSTEKLWHFVPVVSQGDNVSFGSIVGTVKETELITNKIMNKFNVDGKF